MPYALAAPTRRPAPVALVATGALPPVVVLAGSARLAGTSTTAAVLAASVAALGRAAYVAAPHDPPNGEAPGAAALGPALRLVDAGAELAAARDALARNPGALLLVVTGAAPAALAAAFALVKATAPAPAELVVVGGAPAEALAAHARLDEAARLFLGRALRLAAAVPEDPSLAVALAAGMPVHDAAAGSPAAAALHALAERAAFAAPALVPASALA